MFRNIFIPFIIVLLTACSSANNTESETLQLIFGNKTLVADYSIFTDPLDIPESAIPVEPHGFISMSASSSGDVIIAGAAHGKLYYTDDGGVTWFTIEGIGAEEFWSGVTVSADGNTIAVVAQSLYVSQDSGDSWKVYPFEDGYDSDSRLVMSDDGTTIILFEDYGMEVSHDFGETWESPDYPTFNPIIAVSLTADGEKVAALNYFERLRLSLDNGLSWNEAAPDIVNLEVVQPEGGQWTDMKMSPDGKVIALLDAGAGYYPEEKFDLYLSSDGGDNWSKVTVEGVYFADSVAISGDGQKVIVSTDTLADPFMYSEDFGETWSSLLPPVKENENWPHFEHIFSNFANRIVSMERQHSIWTSDDFGKTWIKRLQGLGEE